MRVGNLYFTAFLIFIICVFSVYAGATENRWILYYIDPDDTEYYYDSESIIHTSKSQIKISKGRTSKSSKSRRNYTVVRFVQVKEKIIFNNIGLKLKESRIIREFDCSKRKVRTIMKSETYKNGFQNIEGKICPWENINSEPIYEILYKIVCQP